MIKLDYNYKTEILVIKYIGEVYLSEIIEYINLISENNSYPRILKILTDTGNVSLNFEISDLEKIVIAKNKGLANYNYIFEALVVGNPKSTVFSMLFQQLEKNTKYENSIFSTKEAAISWLNNK